jgi:hypothetical protein
VWAHEPALAERTQLLALLGDPRMRGDARRVLVALGRPGLELLIEALDDPRTPAAVRRHLPRTICRFRDSIAAAALVNRLPHEPDGRTELKLLRALGRMRADHPALPIDAAPIRAYIRRATRDAVRYAVFADHLASHPIGTPTGALMAEILADKRRSAIEHAFRALGILHPRDGVRSAYDAFGTDDDARRVAAREIVASLLPVDSRGALLAVLDDLPPAARRARTGDLAPGPFATAEMFFAALLADPSASLRCVVAGHVAEQHLVALASELERLRSHDGRPLVTQAFDQALAVLHG